MFGITLERELQQRDGLLGEAQVIEQRSLGEFHVEGFGAFLCGIFIEQAEGFGPLILFMSSRAARPRTMSPAPASESLV